MQSVKTITPVFTISEYPEEAWDDDWDSVSAAGSCPEDCDTVIQPPEVTQPTEASSFLIFVGDYAIMRLVVTSSAGPASFYLFSSVKSLPDCVLFFDRQRSNLFFFIAILIMYFDSRVTDANPDP